MNPAAGRTRAPVAPAPRVLPADEVPSVRRDPALVVPGRDWFARDVRDVARDLLGAVVTTRTADGTVAVRLTEVEAYGGGDDPGSHAARGRSARNASMFGTPGRLYVYRHLGLHHCVNVVTGPRDEPAAVLLRAGEVVEGAELAWTRRSRVGRVGSHRDLARGPARLAVCLGVDRDWDGDDVTGAAARCSVQVLEPVLSTASEAGLGRDPGGRVARGPRVGVAGPGGDAARFPWRWWLTDEPTVSPYRRAARRAGTPGASTAARPVRRRARTASSRPPTSAGAP